MIVYAFMYNPMIYESATATVSLHFSKKGAEMAMEFHKAEQQKEWDSFYKDDQHTPKFGQFGNCSLQKVNILL